MNFSFYDIGSAEEWSHLIGWQNWLITHAHLRHKLIKRMVWTEVSKPLINLWKVKTWSFFGVAEKSASHSVLSQLWKEDNFFYRWFWRTTEATLIKCLDHTDGQLKLGGWLYIIFIVYTLCYAEAPFIGYFREEAPFYCVNLGWGWLVELFLFKSKTMLEVGLAGVSVCGPWSTCWKAGHLDQAIFCWCGLR